MKFIALPVKVGDSFYLETSNNRILVDGGQNQQHIIKLLNNEKIPKKHFDVLICTHYDTDHIKGIIGILKSNKYSFKELWLPEIYGSIGYSITKNLYPLLEKLRNSEEVNFNEKIKDNNIDDLYNLGINKESIPNSFEKIDFSLLKEISIECLYCFYSTNIKLYNSLSTISNLLYLTNDSGSYIRWFAYQNKLTDKLVNNNIYAQNCIETAVTLYTPVNFLYALYLTTINIHSLVFKYKEEKYPNILFTADSDLSFCGNEQIKLTDHSIVTAPHHGSSSNDPAYNRINGENLTFVRSDRYQLKRPGEEYLKQTKRYCTVCRNKTEKEKIELILKNGVFNTAKNKCIC